MASSREEGGGGSWMFLRTTGAWCSGLQVCRAWKLLVLSMRFASGMGLSLVWCLGHSAVHA